jgi:hypothetical protein
VPDQALTLELAYGLELLLSRNLGIDPVQLPQVDSLEPETLEAVLQIPAKKLRPAILYPLVGGQDARGLP